MDCLPFLSGHAIHLREVEVLRKPAVGGVPIGSHEQSVHVGKKNDLFERKLILGDTSHLKTEASLLAVFEYKRRIDDN